MPECTMTQQAQPGGQQLQCNLHHNQAGRACCVKFCDSNCHRKDCTPSAVHDDDAHKIISNSCLSTCTRTRQRGLAAYPVCMAFHEGLAHVLNYVGMCLAATKYCLCAYARHVERLQASEHIHKQAANQPHIMRLEVNASFVHTCHLVHH